MVKITALYKAKKATMTKNKPNEMIEESTPLEKVELLFDELTKWYGDAEKKELRVAAKFLMVALDKFEAHGDSDWRGLVMEYVDTMRDDPDKFERMLDSNRGKIQKKKSPDSVH